MQSIKATLLILSLTTLAVSVKTEYRLFGKQGTQLKHKIPDTVIWAWEHNDNLAFIDPAKVAIAYYAGTIILGKENATLISRCNRLELPKAAVAFPVFRIQNAHPDDSASSKSWSAARKLLSEYVHSHSNSIVQIDCDAGVRDRQGYIQFLKDLKKELPANSSLSITALASWCLRDKWLQAVPVDELVPMIFSLGRRRAETLAVMERDGLSTGSPAEESLGFAVNEEGIKQELKELGLIKRASRVYVFSPLGWTKSRYERVLADLTGAR